MATQAYLSNYPAALFTIHGHSILPEQSPSSPIYHTWPLNHTWAITQQPYLLYVATQSYLSNHTAALFTIRGYSILPEQSPSSPIYHTWLLNLTWAIPSSRIYHTWPLNPTWAITQQPFLSYMPTQSYLSNHQVALFTIPGYSILPEQSPAALFTIHGYSILPEQSPSSPIYHTWLLNPTRAIPEQPYLPYMATQSYLSNPPAAQFTTHGHSIKPEQSPSSPIYHTWLLNPTWTIIQQPYLPYMPTQSYLSNHSPLTHQQYVLRMAMHKAANFRTMYLMKASPCKTSLIVDLIFILYIDVLNFSFTWWTPKAIL